MGLTPRGGGAEPLLSLRHYFAIEQLTHPAVKATPCSRLFYQCWQNGFHYDVDTRQVGVRVCPCAYPFLALCVRACIRTVCA